PGTSAAAPRAAAQHAGDSPPGSATGQLTAASGQPAIPGAPALGAMTRAADPGAIRTAAGRTAGGRRGSAAVPNAVIAADRAAGTDSASIPGLPPGGGGGPAASGSSGIAARTAATAARPAPTGQAASQRASARQSSSRQGQARPARSAAATSPASAGQLADGAPYRRPEPAGPAGSDEATSARQAFINQVVPGALATQQRYGVPASVTIAQAIDESGWGTSTLAAADHNLFGIKGSGPAGSTSLPTTEYDGGQAVSTVAGFRVYSSAAQSVEDHGRLLATSGYYGQAMAQRHDPNAFASALTGVYATDPEYGAKLIALMRRYNLYRYDQQNAAAGGSATAAPTRSAGTGGTGRGGTGRGGTSQRGPTRGGHASQPAGGASIPGVPDMPAGAVRGRHPGAPVPATTATATRPATATGPRSTATPPLVPAAAPPATRTPASTAAPAGPAPRRRAPAGAPTRPARPGRAVAPSGSAGPGRAAAPSGSAGPRPAAQPSAAPRPAVSAAPSAEAGPSTEAAAARRLQIPASWQTRRAAPRARPAATAMARARFRPQIPQAVHQAFLTSARTPLIRAEPLYRDVAGQAGLRWQLLAACDWMQCEAQHRYSPVHGERLGSVNADGTCYPTRSAALAQCSDDLARLAWDIYRIDPAAPRPLSVTELAYVFAAFRWGGLLKLHRTSPLEFPYSVAGLTAQHLSMRWPDIAAEHVPDKPGSRFRRPFGAVPIVLNLDYPALA
ncbi:MAG: glucosaminidase domain-containing protein, partial [Streptosporangiaceae bacterium]